MIALTASLNVETKCETINCERPATRVYNAGVALNADSDSTIELCDPCGHILDWRLKKLAAR